MDSIKTLYASPSVTPVSSPVKPRKPNRPVNSAPPPNVPVFNLKNSDEDGQDNGSDIGEWNENADRYDKSSLLPFSV